MIKGKWRVDTDVGAAYFHFINDCSRGIVAVTKALNHSVFLDFDDEGRLYGIEILDLALLPKDHEK